VVLLAIGEMHLALAYWPAGSLTDVIA
jgi:hypothetical protein